MRGKPRIIPIEFDGEGITPAYAGKTLRNISRSGKISDHPRVCGENGENKSSDNAKQGSPPRMRGKRRQIFLCFFNDGITPAYAGKTY